MGAALEGMRFSSNVQDALDFLSPIMRPEDPSQLRLEYPNVFRDSENSGHRILYQDAQPVSGAVFCAYDVQTDPALQFRVGAIGSVATHPDHRGKGYAGQVLQECEKELLNRDCVLSVLWSASPKLYQNNGYIEFGTELDFVLDADAFANWTRPPGVVLPFDPEKDFDGCAQIYEKHSCRVLRSREAFRRSLDIPKMEIFVHRRLGKVSSYAIIGKGADFKDTLHEWGGNPEGVYAMIGDYLLKKPDLTLAVISSPARKDLQNYLETRNHFPMFGKFGMGKLLHRERLLSLVQESMESRFRVQIALLSNGFELSHQGKSVRFSDTDFLRVLFGYRGISALSLQLANELSLPAFKERVPFELFFWGLDSV